MKKQNVVYAATVCFVILVVILVGMLFYNRPTKPNIDKLLEQRTTAMIEMQKLQLEGQKLAARFTDLNLKWKALGGTIDPQGNWSMPDPSLKGQSPVTLPDVERKPAAAAPMVH